MKDTKKTVNLLRSIPKNSTNELINLLHAIPFSPRSVTKPGFPVLGSVLYAYSSGNHEWNLYGWVEAKIRELGIDSVEYIQILGGPWHVDEFHLSPSAGLKIVASFDNKRGAEARLYLDNLTNAAKHDIADPTAPVQVMLTKLEQHQNNLHRLMEDATMWYDIGRTHQPDVEAENTPSQDGVFNAEFSEDVVELAKDRLLHFGTITFNEVRAIVAKMEAIYASPLYAEAVAQGLATSVPNNNQNG